MERESAFLADLLEREMEERDTQFVLQRPLGAFVERFALPAKANAGVAQAAGVPYPVVFWIQVTQSVDESGVVQNLKRPVYRSEVGTGRDAIAE